MLETWRHEIEGMTVKILRGNYDNKRNREDLRTCGKREGIE